MIELKNIGKAYDDQVILQGVNATINEGDVVAVIGPSGCGKSTLLNCINVLNRATSGQVIFDGVDLMDPKCDLKQYRRRIGMVFQSFNLFGNMTILENAINPQVTLLKRSRQEAYENAIKYLTMVGLADRIYHYPEELSGGQKQRAAIARTLSMDPEMILLDEPTSALDPTMVGEVEYVIKKLASQGRTMVIVTHDMKFAKEISNRVFYMDEKGIYEDGPTTQIFEHPKREKTRQFVNRIKTLEIVIDSKQFDFINAMTSLEVYCDKLALSKRLMKKSQLLFEETCMRVILPSLGENPSLRAVFEYKEDEGELSLCIYHSGEKVIGKLGDDLSNAIISSLSKTIPVKEEIV